MDIKNLTIKQIHQGLLNKDFSAAELAEHFLKEIESKNPDLFAYLFLIKKKLFFKQEKLTNGLLKEEK